MAIHCHWFASNCCVWSPPSGPKLVCCFLVVGLDPGFTSNLISVGLHSLKLLTNIRRDTIGSSTPSTTTSLATCAVLPAAAAACQHHSPASLQLHACKFLRPPRRSQIAFAVSRAARQVAVQEASSWPHQKSL
eukprot:GHUV01043183.1.p2 GENE.GHUV01043183.1~~GHUV01043183.1.p2  ORF type:complete len:133 (-),score=16.39 GHUV01043183.1:365-763(-)